MINIRDGMTDSQKFAFDVGLVMGGLHNQEVVDYLKSGKVTDDEIKKVLTALEPIRKAFYVT